MDEVNVVGNDTVATLRITLKMADGSEEDTGPDGVKVLIGHEDIFPEVEKALMGKKVGDKVEVKLEPRQAFGDFDETLIKAVPANLLSDHVEVGMKISGVPGEPDDGRIYTVIDDSGDPIIIDGNHPLAGEAIKVDVEILNVEKPTAEEIEEMEKTAPMMFEVPLPPQS
ncbi:MAG: FKBP-type peptidyl-prolyl cis-trans isomerase [Burkholderiales bacterium]|nr:FKBP-type peptidyl-prolyl cis-trans isomerase [Burkholderiales bacterium]